MTVALEQRRVYNFEVYPVSFLGNDWKNVTVKAIMDFESACREADVVAAHAQYYSSFSSTGVANDPSSYDYIKVKTSAGNTAILGIPWINASTISLVGAQQMKILLDNRVASDIPKVQAALAMNGFPNAKITLG